MPIYEYECPIHGRFEKYLPLSYSDKKDIPCTESIDCEEKAERIWSELGLVSGMSTTKPTVVFRNAANPYDIRPAIYQGQKTPHGYLKEELKTPMERGRVEKEMEKIQDAQDDFDTAKREYSVNHVRKERHADLRARMDSIVKDSDNPEVSKQFLRAAMERTSKKKVPRKKSEFHFAINHDDKSNLTKG